MTKFLIGLLALINGIIVTLGITFICIGVKPMIAWIVIFAVISFIFVLGKQMDKLNQHNENQGMKLEP